MAIGPFKETIADVRNQLYGVGGFKIVKDLKLEIKASNKWPTPSLFKHINRAVRVIAVNYLHIINLEKSR